MASNQNVNLTVDKGKAAGEPLSPTIVECDSGTGSHLVEEDSVDLILVGFPQGPFGVLGHDEDAPP